MVARKTAKKPQGKSKVPARKARETALRVPPAGEWRFGVDDADVLLERCLRQAVAEAEEKQAIRRVRLPRLLLNWRSRSRRS
eukprot:scaffold2208_cov237-Pinguiococcus_pyrenoidosus.AAC.5